MSFLNTNVGNQLLISARYAVHKVKSDIDAEASQNVLSYVWWILEPCLMIGVFYVVFVKLFQRGGEGFVSFLLLGVTAWLWFAHTVSRATSSIRRAMGLLQQVYIPKYVFPFTAVLFGIFKHAFVILILFSLLAILETPSVHWLLSLPIFFSQLLFILAVSTLVASLVPFVPDFQKLIPPLLHMMMFLSGVFYDQSIIPEKWVTYFRYNPMAGLIMEYRKVILYLQNPDWVYLAKVSLCSIVLLTLSLVFLNKFDRQYPRLPG